MVFISYRRADTQQMTGRLRERLADQYGAENVFLDMCDIATGARFLEAIRDALARSDVFLVLIGSRWIDAQNAARLFDPKDVVRQEIETGLASGLTTIPVLIDHAPMPRADQIPDSLHALPALNAASIESGVNFDLGIRRLVERIDEVSAAVAERQATRALRDAAWTQLSEPTQEAVTALARARGDPDRIYAGALLAKRVLRCDADLARWVSYAVLPDGQSPHCLAVSDRAGRRITRVGTTGHLFEYHQADFRWRESAYFARLGPRKVRWIAVNPADPAHILVGTGEHTSGTSMGAGTSGGVGTAGFASLGEANWSDDPGSGDLHGSRDGGVTWRTGPFRNVNRALFAESSSRQVYVVTADQGLFVSSNATASFDPAPGTDKDTLWSGAVSPRDPAHVVLGTQLGGALVSLDAGRTWWRPAGVSTVSVSSVAFAASDARTLIIGTDDGVYLSKDGGRTFAPSSAGLVHKRVLAALALGPDGFALATDGGGIYARATSKEDWRRVYRGLTRAGIGALTMDADDIMYVGGGGTLYRTEDFGRSFQPLHHGVETIRAVCVFSSSSPTGSARSPVRWNRHDVCLIGTERGSIHRSGDYGQTWEGHVLGRYGSRIRKIACSAGRPTLVYAIIEGHELYVSRDEGRSWIALAASKHAPVTFALAEGDPSAIFIGTYKDGVQESVDAGATWRPVAAGLPEKPVVSLVVSSVDGKRRLLAGLHKGGVWRLAAGGKRWLAGRGKIRSESVNDMTGRDKLVLAATDSGVFRSTDGGVNWQDFSEGLVNVKQVNRLALSGDGRKVFCGETGGLYGRAL